MKIKSDNGESGVDFDFLRLRFVACWPFPPHWLPQSMPLPNFLSKTLGILVPYSADTLSDSRLCLAGIMVWQPFLIITLGFASRSCFDQDHEPQTH